MKRKYSSKIYHYECKNCGWKTWRYCELLSPTCSLCTSIDCDVTKEEVNREVDVYETYTPEKYEKAKRVAKDIMKGLPLEQTVDLDKTVEEDATNAVIYDIGSYNDIERRWFRSVLEKTGEEHSYSWLDWLRSISPPGCVRIKPSSLFHLHEVLMPGDEIKPDYY